MAGKKAAGERTEFVPSVMYVFMVVTSVAAIKRNKSTVGQFDFLNVSRVVRGEVHPLLQTKNRDVTWVAAVLDADYVGHGISYGLLGEPGRVGVVDAAELFGDEGALSGPPVGRHRGWRLPIRYLRRVWSCCVLGYLCCRVCSSCW